MDEKLGIKILFIDDEEDVRDIATRMLQGEYGYTNFQTSASVEDARETFQTEHFDVLIIDMTFDGERRGFEILKLGDEEHPLASNMIIFTANDDVMDCRKAFKMGAWDYIPKNLSDENPYEVMHRSIQDAMKHTNTWGNDKDTSWVNDNIDTLMNDYMGQYVYIMDNKVLASATSEEQLQEIIKTKNLPNMVPLIFKVE